MEKELTNKTQDIIDEIDPDKIRCDECSEIMDIRTMSDFEFKTPVCSKCVYKIVSGIPTPNSPTAKQNRA